MLKQANQNTYVIHFCESLKEANFFVPFQIPKVLSLNNEPSYCHYFDVSQFYV